MEARDPLKPVTQTMNSQLHIHTLTQIYDGRLFYFMSCPSLQKNKEELSVSSRGLLRCVM
jgi:hypothetical protein